MVVSSIHLCHHNIYIHIYVDIYGEREREKELALGDVRCGFNHEIAISMPFLFFLWWLCKGTDRKGRPYRIPRVTQLTTMLKADPNHFSFCKYEDGRKALLIYSRKCNIKHCSELRWTLLRDG